MATTTQPISLQQARENAAANADFQAFQNRPRTWLDELKDLAEAEPKTETGGAGRPPRGPTTVAAAGAPRPKCQITGRAALRQTPATSTRPDREI